MKKSMIKNLTVILSYSKPMCWNFNKNKLFTHIFNKRFCTSMKTPKDISIKNTNDTNSIANHINNLNLPRDKLFKQADLEFLKQNMLSEIQEIKSNSNYKEDLERKLISLQHLLINYENYSKFIEIIRKTDSKPKINKNSNRKIEIIKKDDRLIINLNDLTQKNIYLSVLFNKRIRAENPEKVNNLMFLLTL